MEKQLTSQHRRAIVPVLDIFKVRKAMSVGDINNRYAKAFGKYFAPRQFGFKNMSDLVAKLRIFKSSQAEEIAISKEKLLQLTVAPLLVEKEVESTFEEDFFQLNGFQFSVLRKYFEVDTVEELLKPHFTDTHYELDMVATGRTIPVVQSPVTPPDQAFCLTQSPNTAPVRKERKQRKALLSHPEQPTLPSSLGQMSSVPHPGCHVHMQPSPLPIYEQIGPGMSPRAHTFLPPIAGGPSLLPAKPLPKPIAGPFLFPVTASSESLVSAGRSVQMNKSDLEAGPRGGTPPHFPNNQMPFADESYLPPTHVARPDMEVYQLPRQLTAPTFSARDSREKVKAKLDAYMQNFISVFSSKGKHLPADLVFNEAVARLQEAFRFCRFKFPWYDIPSCKNFEKRYKRICEFIRVFCWNCPICSLFDLQRIILEFEKVSSFDELQMGPIFKHPLIKDFFKPSKAVVEVPEITAYDIQLTVKKFIDSTSKGMQFKLEEFMEFFARSQGVESPSDLCIRIVSFRLAVSVSMCNVSYVLCCNMMLLCSQSNLRFRTSQRLIRESLQATVQEKMEEAIEFEVSNMKKKLSRSSEQKYLLEKDPALLLQEVFACAMPLCDGRLHSRLSMFFDLVIRNRSFRKLFQLAIYQGAYGMKNTMKEAEEHHQSMQAMFSMQQGAEAMDYKTPGRQEFSSLMDYLLYCLFSHCGCFYCFKRRDTAQPPAMLEKATISCGSGFSCADRGRSNRSIWCWKVLFTWSGAISVIYCQSAKSYRGSGW